VGQSFGFSAYLAGTNFTERVRALRFLARCPDGCPERLMLEHGFGIAFLAGLVRDHFAIVELNTTRVVIQITDLRREVLTH
jgi:hypothetical protein